MAEGGLEGLIGGEGEEAAEGAAGADPAAMALALDGAKYDPKLAREARAYLKQQTRLVGIQTEHLHEQRAVLLSNLKLRRASETFKVAVQALLALIVAGVAATLIFMVWSATQDHGVVVEPFSVPPELAQRGVTTGEVVAQEVLDRLSALQSETGSARPANSYRNNWSDNLKVEIPETGVSLGEVQRLLNGWLGHETHISGEVIQSPDGLAISARADATVARVSGAENDFDTLLQQAAEAVYGQTQPYRYAVYLGEHGKAVQGDEILQKLTGSANSLERAWALSGLAVDNAISGDIPAAARNLALAAQTAPNLIVVRLSLAKFVESPLDHAENALTLDRFVLSHKATFRGQVSPDVWGDLLNEMGEDAASITNDAAESLAIRNTADKAESGVQPVLRAGSDALHGLLTHDPAEIRQAATMLSGEPAFSNSCLGIAALEAHDPASVGLLSAAMKADLASPSGTTSAKRVDTYWVARAKAAFGDIGGAKALIFATPMDCYHCVMGRGEILAQAGDRAGAERWFAEAIRQGPDVPSALTARGEARLVWGRCGGGPCRWRGGDEDQPARSRRAQALGRRPGAAGAMAGCPGEI